MRLSPVVEIVAVRRRRCRRCSRPASAGSRSAASAWPVDDDRRRRRRVRSGCRTPEGRADRLDRSSRCARFASSMRSRKKLPVVHHRQPHAIGVALALGHRAADVRGADPWSSACRSGRRRSGSTPGIGSVCPVSGSLRRFISAGFSPYSSQPSVTVRIALRSSRIVRR